MRKKGKTLMGVLLAISLIGGTLGGCGQSETVSSGVENTRGGSQVETALSVETRLTNTKLEGQKDSSKKTVTTLLEFTPEPAGHGHPYVEGGPNWSLQPLIYL